MPAPLLLWAAREVDRRSGGKLKRIAVLTLLIPLLIAVAMLAGVAGTMTPPAGAGTCGAGSAVPSSADIPVPVMDAINALKPDYEAVASTSGVGWNLLAAVDYRENGNSPDRSMLSGELIGTTNPDSGAVTSSKRDSIERGAEHLKAMASSVYGVTLTADSGGDDIKAAALAYNRGSIYKNANAAPDRSPYVMNQYDAGHTDMAWPADVPGEPLAGQVEYGRLGAYTLFTRLGGATGSCGLSDDDIVRIAQQEIGIAEDNAGSDCDCGAPLKYQGTTGPEDWCADFVSWVYREAGRPFTTGLDGGWRLPGVYGLHQWIVTNGHWFARGAAEDPRPGDVIVFGGDSHTGIVERLDDGGTPGNPGDDVIHTIEGNTSDRVARREYGRQDGYVDGWGRQA